MRDIVCCIVYGRTDAFVVRRIRVIVIGVLLTVIVFELFFVILYTMETHDILYKLIDEVKKNDAQEN